MCGRFTMHHSADQIALRFEVDTLAASPPPRFNIAPTQPVAVITENSPRTLQMMRWGLIPSWAKDPAIGSKLINARAETLAEKPSFKAALARRRCLIPADGFYEWKQEGTHQKQPMYIHTLADSLFAFAGLWEEWKAPGAEPLRTCTIITVAPNALLATIHNRMPAILRKEDEAAWLHRETTDINEVLPLLYPYPDEEMQAYPVSRRVNWTAAEEADLINPV
jgi:putative SOS response-associated peptidase YedK